MSIKIVVGPPGTGKTTYLASKALDACQQFGPNAVIVASLTKAAASELLTRDMPLPKNRIGTLHSHAYQALGCPDIAETSECFSSFSEDNKSYKITSHSPNMEDAPTPLGESNNGDRLFQYYKLYRAQMKPRKEWLQEVQNFAEAWEKWKEGNEVRDFEDLIEDAIHETLAAPGNPKVIYLDEAQDHSKSEFSLALHWSKRATGTVMVGDMDQTIYAWRGADPFAFQRLEVPEEDRKVLSQSYRVPGEVHKYAVSWIRRIKNREENEYKPKVGEKGAVKNLISASYKSPNKAIDRAVECIEDGKSVMFLTTCSYMLEPLKAILKKRGIPFHNPYRLTRGDWNPLQGANRVQNYLRPEEETWRDHARPWTWHEAWSWRELVSAEHLVRGTKKAFMEYAKNEKLKDLPLGKTMEEAMNLLGDVFKKDVDFWEKGNPSLLKQLVLDKKKKIVNYPLTVRERFGGKALLETPKIILGTVFSVKGGEADVVFVFPDLSPAGMVEWTHKGPSRDGIIRLFYVAFTRAKKELVLCNAATRKAVQLPRRA